MNVLTVSKMLEDHNKCHSLFITAKVECVSVCVCICMCVAKLS